MKCAAVITGFQLYSTGENKKSLSFLFFVGGLQRLLVVDNDAVSWLDLSVTKELVKYNTLFPNILMAFR